MTPEELKKFQDQQDELQRNVLGTLEKANAAIEAGEAEAKDAKEHRKQLDERLDKLEDTVRAAGEIGMDEEETMEFSLSRVANAVALDDWSNAKKEREMIAAATEQRAAQSTLTDSAGGHLLPVEVSNRIIEPLKRKAILGRAGATFMEGMRGTFEMPKATAGEHQDRDDADAVSDQSSNWIYSNVSLSANHSGQIVKVSRSLLQQGNAAADLYIENQLQKAAARKIDAIGLAIIQAMTATADTIAAPAAAGDKLTPRMLQRAWTLLQNNEVMDADTKLAFIANPLVKWHLLDGAAYSSATPWIPYANDASLQQALGAEVLSTTFFNDDSGVNGEAVLGAFEHLIVALFGQGIELAKSEHSSFENNLVDFRALLAADAVSVYDEAFIHWDTLGDA